MLAFIYNWIFDEKGVKWNTLPVWILYFRVSIIAEMGGDGAYLFIYVHEALWNLGEEKRKE